MMRTHVLLFVAAMFAVALGCGDDGGSTAPAAPSAPVVTTPVNRAPQASRTIPDQTLTLGEYERVNLDLDAYFSDPDGDTLAYEVVSSNTHVAEVRLSNATVGLVARHLGRADVRATASDSGGLGETQRFFVTVERGDPRAELEITKCEADGVGVVDVAVEGTVRAVTRLSSARVIAYVDTQRVGDQALGDMAAGETRQFVIRGSAPVSSTSECHVEFTAGGESITATAFLSFRGADGTRPRGR